jgi:hypothetical protein
MARLEGESPQGELTPQRNTNPEADRTDRNIPEPFQDALGKLSEAPLREDPAFWPVRVLNELTYMILERDHASDRPNVWGVNARELGERFAPYQEHIRQVRTAYEILAYPHCKSAGSREVIEGQLAQDQWANEREQVELTDAELAILSRLAAAKNIPFNPEKRVYHYDEVFHPSPDIEPPLTGATYTKWLSEQIRLRTQERGR